MIEQKLEELRYYFTGYGSPHDETILKMIEQNKRYRELIKKLKRMVYDPDVDCGMICTEIIEMEESE